MFSVTNKENKQIPEIPDVPIQPVENKPIPEIPPEPIQPVENKSILESLFSKPSTIDYPLDTPQNTKLVTITNNEIIVTINKRSDFDLEIIYTPLYFKTVDLDAENVIIMKGGYSDAEYNNLTSPYKNIVWLVERNPISLSVHNWIYPSDKEKPIKDLTSQKPFFSLPTITMPEISMPDFTSNKKQVAQEEVKAEVNEEVKEEEQEVQETEVQEPEEIKEPDLQEEVKELEVQEEPRPNTIVIKFDIEKNIEYNGKDLKFILDIHKKSPRTIESIPESGMTYLLLEQIVFDMHSQLTFLNENFNVIYSEFREEFIYNINGKYVILDSEKITYNSNDPEKIKEKTKENNEAFSNFIQKMKFGESSSLFPSNDTIIENTRVEKLRANLLR